jgi:di/tripeptidase
MSINSLKKHISVELLKSKFTSLCYPSQSDLYKILVNELKSRNYNVYYNDQGDNCSKYIYAQGEIPICLVAHLDTVFTPDRNPRININGNTITSPDGLGADDRLGVFMILELIKEYKCNVLFLADEEHGHSGALYFIDGPYRELFMQNNNFIIGLDLSRSNILTFYKTENKEFQNDIINILPNYEIRDPKEGSSDIVDISIGKHGYNKFGKKEDYEGTNVASLNIGIGYYNEHTLNEYVNFNETIQVLDDVKSLIVKMPNKKYTVK